MSPVVHRLAGALCALGVLLCASSPVASAEPRIVLVTAGDATSLALRIRAELKAIRFEVLDMSAPDGPPSREPLELAARERDAVAAVRVVPSKAGVEVWIVDRVTGKTVLRELVQEDPTAASSEAAIALRVTELLRASLMEINAPRPPHGEVEAPTGVRDLVDAPRAQIAPPAPAPAKEPGHALFSAVMGPGLLLDPGNTGPAGLLHVAVTFRPVPWIGGALFALIPMSSFSVRGPEGAATVRTGFVGAGAESVLAPRGSAWAMAAGAGLSLFWLTAEGTASGPFYASRRTSLVTAAPYVRVGGRFELLPRLHLRAEVLGGITLQRPVIELAGRAAASFGSPFFVPSLAAEVGFP